MLALITRQETEQVVAGTLGIGTVPLVFVPTNGPGYDALLVGPDDDRTIKIGAAQQRRGSKGGHLEVTLDCPTFDAPIKATMRLTPSREGTYSLQWTRRTKC